MDKVSIGLRGWRFDEDEIFTPDGDAEIQRCNVAEVVYGEPFEEVVLCTDHEPDFRYWFLEEGGRDLAGTDAFEDGFHEWFLDGGRAPAGYGGIDHVETAPDDLPEFDREDFEAEPDDDDGVEAETGKGESEGDADADTLDLGIDYPTRD